MGAHASREARVVLEAVRRIVRMLRQSAREAQQRTGLSGAQLFVLQQLRAAGGALTPGELAQRTLTHQSSVSVVVRRLVDKGFVSRARSSSDARRIELTLTAAGRKTARRVPRLAEERLIEAVDGLSPPAGAGAASRLAALVARLGARAAAAALVFPEAALGGRLGLRDAAAPMFFEEGAGGAQ